MDSPFSNKAWADQIGVSFPIVSDWGGEVTRKYGIFNPKYKAARRTTLLVDTTGRIVEIQQDEQAIDPSHIVVACERRKKKG